MGTPAGSTGSGNPICKRAGGSTTCSVEGLNVSSNYREAIKFTSSHGGWWFCCVGWFNSRGEVTPGAGSKGGGGGGGGGLDPAAWFC